MKQALIILLIASIPQFGFSQLRSSQMTPNPGINLQTNRFTKNLNSSIDGTHFVPYQTIDLPNWATPFGKAKRVAFSIVGTAGTIGLAAWILHKAKWSSPELYPLSTATFVTGVVIGPSAGYWGTGEAALSRFGLKGILWRSLMLSTFLLDKPLQDIGAVLSFGLALHDIIKLPERFSHRVQETGLLNDVPPYRLPSDKVISRHSARSWLSTLIPTALGGSVVWYITDNHIRADGLLLAGVTLMGLGLYVGPSIGYFGTGSPVLTRFGYAGLGRRLLYTFGAIAAGAIFGITNGGGWAFFAGGILTLGVTSVAVTLNALRDLTLLEQRFKEVANSQNLTSLTVQPAFMLAANKKMVPGLRIRLQF